METLLDGKLHHERTATRSQRDKVRDISRINPSLHARFSRCQAHQESEHQTSRSTSAHTEAYPGKLHWETSSHTHIHVQRVNSARKEVSQTMRRDPSNAQTIVVTLDCNVNSCSIVFSSCPQSGLYSEVVVLCNVTGVKLLSRVLFAFLFFIHSTGHRVECFQWIVNVKPRDLGLDSRFRYRKSRCFWEIIFLGNLASTPLFSGAKSQRANEWCGADSGLPGFNSCHKAMRSFSTFHHCQSALCIFRIYSIGKKLLFFQKSCGRKRRHMVLTDGLITSN